jgi:hypothetical protein
MSAREAILLIFTPTGIEVSQCEAASARADVFAIEVGPINPTRYYSINST